MLRFGFWSCFGLLDVGGIGSLGVHTCCERAICSLAVSFVLGLHAFFFFELLGGILMMMLLGGGDARLRWFLTVFVDLF